MLEGVLDLPREPCPQLGLVTGQHSQRRESGPPSAEMGEPCGLGESGREPHETAAATSARPELLVPARVGVRRLGPKGCRWAGWQVSTCLCARGVHVCVLGHWTGHPLGLASHSSCGVKAVLRFHITHIHSRFHALWSW